jgi:NAD(P)H-dependent FMN reductase
MRIFIVNGSHRKEAQSLKVGRYLERRLSELDLDTSVFLFNLTGSPLPFWDEDYGGVRKELWGPIEAELKSADALILITPEWNGMATSGIKNFLHLCRNTAVGHKPALLVSVSAGINGAYPIAELRMTGGKNNRLCFIPEHVIVRNAPSVLNDPDPEQGNRHDVSIRRRFDYALRLLVEYGHSLKRVRESGLIDHENFANGM